MSIDQFSIENCFNSSLMLCSPIRCACISYLFKYPYFQNWKISQTSRIKKGRERGTAADADRPLASNGNQDKTADGHHATDTCVETFPNQLPVHPNSQFSKRNHASADGGLT